MPCTCQGAADGRGVRAWPCSSCCSWQETRPPDRMTASGQGWLNIQLIQAPCPARSSTTAVGSGTTPRAGSEGQCAPSFLHPLLIGSGWVVLTQKQSSLMLPNPVPACPYGRAGLTACGSCCCLLGVQGSVPWWREHNKQGASRKDGAVCHQYQECLEMWGKCPPSPSGHWGAMGWLAPLSGFGVGAG